MNHLETNFDRTEFLSARECTLVTDSDSYFDGDNDLVLIANASSVRAEITFQAPVKKYQFIEIEVFSVSEDNLVQVIALGDMNSNDGTGTYTRTPTPFNRGHFRTYRFPYIGEVEGFVFDGFGTSGKAIVKSIRFYSLPEGWRLVHLDPDTEGAIEVGITYAELVGTYQAQSQTYAELSATYNEDYKRWEITIAHGPGSASGIADFSSSPYVHNVLRIIVPQLGRTSIGYALVHDQVTLLSPVQTSAKVSESMIDADVLSVPIALHFEATAIGRPGITYYLEQFKVVDNSSTNAFGCVHDDAEVLGQETMPISGLRGPQGYQGDVGDRGFQGFQGTQGVQGAQSAVQGPQGTQGTQGPQGDDAEAGALQSVTITSDQDFEVPADVTGIWIDGIGAGGGGYGTANSSTQGGAGGGAGEQGTMLMLTVTPLDLIPVVIGTGGAGGASGGNDGQDGGDTTIGPYTFKGGRGGTTSGGNTKGGQGGGISGGAGGGTNTQGSLGTAASSQFFGGSGGGGGGGSGQVGAAGGGSGGYLSGGSGGSVVSTHAGGGGGAATVFGVGGNGGAGDAAGNDATNPGTGGGGAGANTANAGGDGFRGQVTIYWVGAAA